MTVRYKNELLTKYDDALNNIRKVMDQAVIAIKTSNEYNMNEIVESLLKIVKNGSDNVKIAKSGTGQPHVQAIQQKTGYYNEHG